MVGLVLIEDSPVARDYLAATLSTDPEIVVLRCSADIAQAQGAIASEQTRVVVVGYHPPHTSGLDVAALVRAVRDVPVILVYQGWAETDAALATLATKAQGVGVAGVLRGPLGLGRSAQADFCRRLCTAVKQASSITAARPSGDLRCG